MNNIHGETISALLDGEIDPREHRDTVSKLIDSGPDALARFGRYQLIGDLMRDEASVIAGDVAGRVHDALRDEPTLLAPPPRRTLPTWLKPLAGVAVAASVAAAAVVVAPQLLTGEQGGVSQQVANVAPPVAAPQLVAVGNPVPRPPLAKARADLASATAAPRWQALDAALEDRLNRLVIEHQEFGGRTGVNGPVAHIGFVSYEAR